MKADGKNVTREEVLRLMRTRGRGTSLRDLKIEDGRIVRPAAKAKASAPRPPRVKPAPDPPGLRDDHPPSRITVVGEPVAVLVFDRVPSLNDYDWAARSSPYAGDKFAEEWQTRAHLAAVAWAYESDLPRTELVAASCADGTPSLRFRRPVLSHTRAGLVWRIYSRTRQKADRPLNLTIKPLCDGLTHAGFWPDDDDKHVPLTLHLYCGVDRARPRVELEIHALAP